MTKTITSGLGLSAFLFAAAPITASAALTTLYSTDFNSPTYSDGGLIGQDNWAITGASVVNPISVANTASDGSVTLNTTGQDVNRPFTPAVNSGSIFLRASINVTSAQATGDYFLHFGDGGTSNFYARLWIRSENTGYVMALGTSSGTAVNYGTSVLTLGIDTTILVRYDFVPGLANDTGALFINPVSEDGTGDTPYVLATTIGTDPAGSISSVNFRQGSATNAAVVEIDNLVVAVPEPSATLLGLLAGVGLLRRRCR